MSLANIAATLEGLLDANWSDTPYSFDNLPARDLTEAGQPLLSQGDKDFILFAFGPYDSMANTIPRKCLRVWGSLLAEIYVKEDTGTRRGFAYADALNTLLTYREFSGIRVKNFSMDGSYNTLPGWATVTCSWDFETEFTLSP